MWLDSECILVIDGLLRSPMNKEGFLVPSKSPYVYKMQHKVCEVLFSFFHVLERDRTNLFSRL